MERHPEMGKIHKNQFNPEKFSPSRPPRHPLNRLALLHSWSDAVHKKMNP